MGTNYIAPIWRMPRNANKNKLSNYSIDFGTTSQHISTPSTWQTDVGLDDVKKVSFSVWVNPNSGTGSNIMAITSQAYGSWGGNFNITYRADTTTLSLDFRGVGSVFTNSSTTLTPDTWSHICFVIDLTLGGTIAQEVRCFVNNSEVANQSTATPPVNFVLKTTSFNIGKTLWGSGFTGYQWEGKIAQACFFDYALDLDQIIYLYNLNNPMAISGGEPVAYWPLGDNSNPNATAGYPNVSVGADSVFDFIPNDYINLGEDVVPATPAWTSLTVSGWIKKDATGSYGRVIGKDDGGSNRVFLLQVQNNDKLSASIRTVGGSAWNNAETTTNVAIGEWQHVAMTYTANGLIRVYINGQVEASTSTNIANLNPVTTNTLIGAKGNITNLFDGQISNVQIWDAELSPTEMIEVYNNGQPLMTGTQPQEANLQAWYKLNQTANWEADTAGNWQIPDAVSSYPQSFSFDGSNDFINTNLNVDNYTNLTYSVWVNPTSLNQKSGISDLSSSDNFGAYFWSGSGGQFYVNIGNSFSNIAGTWSLNKFGTLGQEKWLHIAIVYDGSGATDADRLKVYADGDYVAFNSVGSIPTSIPSGGGDLIIGKTNTYEWDGKMSNVMLFNSSLPATGTDSIETLYNNGTPLTTAIATDNLKAWYKLNNNELFDGTNWSVENQKYPANWESSLNSNALTGMLRDSNSKSEFDNQLFSMSVWVKPKSAIATNGDIFACKGSSWQGVCLQYIGNSLMLQLGDKNTTAINGDGGNWSYFNNRVVGASPTYTPYDQWSHIVVVWNGTDSKFYINGDLVSTITPPSALTIDYSQTSVITAIGGRNDAGGSYFTGNVSNFAYWESELDQTAVTALYNNGTPEVTISQSPNHWLTLKDFATGAKDKIGDLNYLQSGTVEFVDNFVSIETGTSSGMTEQNLVNNNVSVFNGESVDMNTTNLVQSNLTKKQPFSSYSVEFDGTSDYFDCKTSSFSAETGMSVSGWVYPTVTGTGAAEAIVSNDISGTGTRGFYLALYNGSNFRWQISTDGTNKVSCDSFNGSLPGLNQWIHVAGTWDATNMKIYINGVLNRTISSGLASGTFTNTNNILIGARESTPVGLFPGNLSNVSIFNSTLNDDDILNLYNNGVSQDLNNFKITPRYWWPMDESYTYFNGSVLMARDVINSNDGTGANVIQENIIGNAPGSEANGTGTNLTITDLKGNMKDSKLNAFSINMADYADGVTNPANSGRSTEVPSV